ncbi:MAG: gamma-glutamyl-gamma-aminobutyrate hydrolase family protein [Actinomycetota bacterium]
MDTTQREGWIAVVGQLRKDHGRLPLSYCEAVAAAGGSPRVISTFHLLADEDVPANLEVVSGVGVDDTSVLDGAIGVLLPGGGDIDPEWYGCPTHPKTTRVSHRRDRFELNLLEVALERDMPVLGICHGMQLLNVHLGGTLDQHLADVPHRLAHDIGMPRTEPVHELRIKERSRLARIMQTATTEVNSHHHQGVGVIGHGLEEVAWAEDGVVEGVIHNGYAWIVGVQWHPEAMAAGHPSQAHLFAAFVDAAEAFAERTGIGEPPAQTA